MINKRKLMAIAIACATAISVTYACNETANKLCHKGESHTNHCGGTYAAWTYTYTTTSGKSVEFCKGVKDGDYGCQDGAKTQCIYNWSRTSCPNLGADSGSQTNDYTPNHADGNSGCTS